MSNAAFGALAAGALLATIIDIRSRRIPNALTASMTGVGLGLALSGLSGVSPAASLAGLIVGLMLMMPGHMMGATGAGDVKLMAAVGAILGIQLVVTAFLFTAIAGGVLAVAVAVRRRRLAATLAGTGRMISAPTDLRREVREASPVSRFAYGPAIAIGSVMAAIVG
ncbi:MAG: A24 family peptidase [Acidobacteriota bacterium]|nr:A24 family peptidase [Acidobacteriota bacterium]